MHYKCEILVLWTKWYIQVLTIWVARRESFIVWAHNITSRKQWAKWQCLCMISILYLLILRRILVIKVEILHRSWGRILHCPGMLPNNFFFFHYSMFMTLSVVAEGIVKALVMMMIMMFSWDIVNLLCCVSAFLLFFITIFSMF